MPDGLKRLSDRLGYEFKDQGLLREALTHPSLPAKKAKSRGSELGYERLEFLGDRVLGLIIAEALFNRFPADDEGALTRRFQALVCGDTLAQVAERIDLAAHLVASSSESEGRGASARLSNACEAVIGAIYLDGGLGAAAVFVHRFWDQLVEEVVTPPKDPKTALQEWAQGGGRPLPTYETVAQSGPSHAPQFEVRVTVQGCEPVTATGGSKRLAERAAAEALLAMVKK